MNNTNSKLNQNINNIENKGKKIMTNTNTENIKNITNENGGMNMSNDLTLEVFLTNLRAYDEGELRGRWVEVNVNTDWHEELQYIQDDPNDGYFVSDYCSNFDGRIDENATIEELQKIAEILEDINDQNLQEEFKGIICFSTSNIEEAYNQLIDGNYTYFPGVNDEEELGYYLVDEGYFDSIPDNLYCYLDFESIGRDYMINSLGGFTDNGFIGFY